MTSAAITRFSALPPIQQRALAVLACVHQPLPRSSFADWLAMADVRDERKRQLSAKALLPWLEHWMEQGLCTQFEGGQRNTELFRVPPTVSTQLLAHLHSKGQLDALLALVRRNAPLTGRYGYEVSEWALCREVMLATLFGTNEPLERAFTLYRPRYGENVGHMMVAALGFEPSAEGLSRLGLESAKTYLSGALEFANEQLACIGEGPLAYLRASGALLDSRLLADAALHLTLRGEPDAASALLADRDDPELAAARCFIALGRADFAEARAQARHAIEQTRTKKTKKLKGLPGSLWPWVLLALLTDREAASLELAREQLAISSKKHERTPMLATPLVGLHAFVSNERLERTIRPEWARHANGWRERLLWLLALRFMDVPLPKELLGPTRELAAHAQRAGFVWLADQLEHAISKAEPRGLASLYSAEEPWERSLRALDAAIQLAERTQPSAAPTGGAQERLVWTLAVDLDGSHQLSARVQTRTANGFSSGRQVTWKKLAEARSDESWLSAEDRRVIHHIRASRDPIDGITRHVLDGEAPVSLVGHPRVFADPECRTPVEVVAGLVRLEVREEGADIALSLSPRACLERDVVCERDGQGRVLVYALTPGQRIIAQQLGKRGLGLPARAKDKLQGSLGKLVSHFAVASEVGVDAAHLEEVAADARIHVQLRRSAGGLAVRPCVAPLGTAPVFAPGRGSRSVLGTLRDAQGTRTVRCTRDLADEEGRLAGLLAACPTLAESEHDGRDHRIPELTRCLELLCELRRVDDVVVEWPEGEAMTLVAERGLRDVRLRVESEGSWFSAQGELPVDEALKLSLQELLAGRDTHGRFVALDDGRFLALSEELRRTLEGLAPLTQPRGSRLELHPLALFGLSNLAEAQLSHDAVVGERLRRAREASALEPTLPSAFEAELRPYQAEGFAWLSRLAHWGAGACLADDMGLGKTLQTLALLVAQAAHGPALVVAPTSVCANWCDEARKFAPGLRLVRFGAGNRERVVEELAAQDVLVCSYGLLQQESELLAKKRFRVVVLDEAQAIKNAATQRAKAAFELTGEIRVALSGTPVENHLGELWSIMSFLNPGLLGSAKAFEERFAKPIQREGDRQAAQLLKRLVRPFVLRRKKSEVLEELPPKTVITLRVEPSEQERALFAALREQALSRLTDRDKPAETRMRLLAELMRMRRAACHPDLVAPDAGIASSKLSALETLLEELREGGHRALVFSQWVDYLSIVRERLKALGIAHQYLDGSSSPQARAAAVSAFQAGQGDVFLISLKAGGFGLNLTAADYVVHLDPWWNPAVEDQASDRAHRMGQTRPVTIYRLVMEGSVEEKILGLHAHKRDLADDLLEGTGGSGALSVDELIDLLEEASGEPDEGRTSQVRVSEKRAQKPRQARSEVS